MSAQRGPASRRGGGRGPHAARSPTGRRPPAALPWPFKASRSKPQFLSSPKRGPGGARGKETGMPGSRALTRLPGRQWRAQPRGGGWRGAPHPRCRDMEMSVPTHFPGSLLEASRKKKKTNTPLLNNLMFLCLPFNHSLRLRFRWQWLVQQGRRVSVERFCLSSSLRCLTARFDLGSEGPFPGLGGDAPGQVGAARGDPAGSRPGLCCSDTPRSARRVPVTPPRRPPRPQGGSWEPTGSTSPGSARRPHTETGLGT